VTDAIRLAAVHAKGAQRLGLLARETPLAPGRDRAGNDLAHWCPFGCWKKPTKWTGGVRGRAEGREGPEKVMNALYA
tara:strand:+ start:2770 stop:3000 length:231 start_codon:yes stop_codon:yes gene_type:complete